MSVPRSQLHQVSGINDVRNWTASGVGVELCIGQRIDDCVLYDVYLYNFVSVFGSSDVIVCLLVLCFMVLQRA